MNASAYVRYAVVVAALAALGTLGLAPASSASTAGTIGADPIAITITNGGIVTNVEEPQGGLYVVTVKNDTCDARGIVMKGLDRGGSRYVRFTKVLGPGETQQFRWYFPVDRSIKLRDLMSCTHEKMTCVVAGYGGMTRSIHFG
jgi:hypothetical protein